FRGVQLRLEWARVNGKERIAFLQVSAIGKMNFSNASGYLGLNRDNLTSNAAAHFIEIVGHILRSCRCHRYGRRRPLERRRLLIRATYKDKSNNRNQTGEFPGQGK